MQKCKYEYLRAARAVCALAAAGLTLVCGRLWGGIRTALICWSVCTVGPAEHDLTAEICKFCFCHRASPFGDFHPQEESCCPLRLCESSQ